MKRLQYHTFLISPKTNSSTARRDKHVSHYRVASLQYSCLESIRDILNKIASIYNLKESQSTIQSYLFEVNRTAVKDSIRFPPSYSNILMNYLLSSEKTNENVIQLIVTLGSSFLLNKLVVPRDFSKPQLLEHIFHQFHLQSVDFSYCQFLDDSLVNRFVQCMTHHTQPLRKLVLRGTMFTQINALNPLTRLECLDISELNYLQPIPDCKSLQDYIQHFSKTFPQLTDLNIYNTNLSSQEECVPNRRFQLLRPVFSKIILVHLDLSCSQSQNTPPLIAEQVHKFFHNLSTISTLEYLDVSFWPVKIENFRTFQQRNTMLGFLGLLGTDIVRNPLLSAITSEFTSTCDETSVINSIRRYADRRDYVNYIVNRLIEVVDMDTHQFEHPNELTNILLDIIEENYLYNKTSLPLPIHMPTFVDITYIISRILDKVFLDHLSSHTVKRIIFMFNIMLKLANVNTSCNKELLLNIFTVLSNFIFTEYISFLETFINDVYQLVLQLLETFKTFSSRINFFSSLSNFNTSNLLEVSTLVLSHFSWNHFQNDNLMVLADFLYFVTNVILTTLEGSKSTIPTLGYLAAIMSSIFRSRSKELKHLLSDQLCKVLTQAHARASNVFVENVSKCFEYVMESFFTSEEDICDVKHIHKIVECAFSCLSTEGLDDNIVYSLCATIVYYWCTVGRMFLQSPIVEKEATLVLVRSKLCEIQRNISDIKLLRLVTELMRLLLSYNEGAVKPILEERERDELRIPFIRSHNNLYNRVKKVSRGITIHINIHKSSCYQSITQMCLKSVIPPPYEQQKHEIHSLMYRLLQDGEYCYLIHIEWFRRWKRYVGYDNCNMSNAGLVLCKPGPIDNTSLLDEGKLRRDQVDEIDYTLVPEEVWYQLVSWYGIGRDSIGIRRQVVEYEKGVRRFQVEIYPIELKACLYHNEEDYKIVTMSRCDTIQTLDKLIRQVYNIESTKHTRVYKKNHSRNFRSSYQLIQNMNLDARDVELFDDLFVLLEVQNADFTHTPSLVSDHAVTPFYANRYL